ncbi:MAG: exodeoxyribonuclease VII small subunit [Edaphobacter sp.]
MPKFEEQLKALENVVEQLEHGELSLEDSVRLFEEGMKLSDACKKELDVAEGKIQVLADRGGVMKAVNLDSEEDVEDEE